MRVIFLKDIKNVGRVGEIKEISDGYAKNFLLPKGLVKLATEGAVNAIEARKKQEQEEISRLKTKMKELEADSNRNPIVLKVKTGEHNEIFGGIREEEIEAALKARKYDNLKLDKLERPIKSIGLHKVKIKLGKGIEGEIAIEVRPL